ESIQHPRTHRTAARNGRAGVHERVRLVMIDGVGDHRADDADVVGHAADVWKQFADFLTGPTAKGKGKLWRKTNQLLILKLGNLLSFGERVGHGLPVEPGKLRFVVKSLQVRRPPSHVKEDYPFGAWGIVKRMHCSPPARQGSASHQAMIPR